MTSPPQQPPPTTTTTTTNPNRDHFLRHLTHLNKLSHKITKPTSSHHTTPPPPPPPQQPPQPPVYNISKSDFRDVVQRLTGSPSHSPTTTAATTKPNSSRLQRIRPPPLTSARSAFGPGLNPMSPLPPLPTCHSSAESPISAYMRFLNANDGFMFPPPENFDNPGDSFGCLPSPKLILPLSPTVSSPK